MRQRFIVNGILNLKTTLTFKSIHAYNTYKKIYAFAVIEPNLKRESGANPGQPTAAVRGMSAQYATEKSGRRADR